MKIRSSHLLKEYIISFGCVTSDPLKPRQTLVREGAREEINVKHFQTPYRIDVRGTLHFQVIILGEEEGEDNDQPLPWPHSYVPDRKQCLPTHPNITSYNKALHVKVLYLILCLKLILKYKFYPIFLKLKSTCVYYISCKLWLHKT